MIPVEQRALHNPEKGIMGDCFSAVVASMLHLPIEEVPLFAAYEEGVWLKELNRWLFQYNLCYIAIQLDSAETAIEWIQNLGIKNLYHEAAGDSPRFPGTGHSTIGKDGMCIFDPHPEGTGVTNEDHYWVGLFVSLTPWKNVEKHV